MNTDYNDLDQYVSVVIRDGVVIRVVDLGRCLYSEAVERNKAVRLPDNLDSKYNTPHTLMLQRVRPNAA